jgi:hypothetical protein
MTRTRRRMTALLATLALAATSVIVPASLGNPKPPTNGGNGAGQSGQCTGAAADRPASCQSP